MARENEFGKFIISAGEIGAYTVCPEAWRLGTVERLRKKGSVERVRQGKRLHEEWAKTYEESAYLSRQTKIVFLFLFIGVVATLIKVLGG